MQRKGEDCPTENDIDEFGLYYACQRTYGNFSLYKNDEYAARGRIGTSPLYWDRKTQTFSFKPCENYEEFPSGNLYNCKNDRLVCWDPMYFDKPCKTLKNAHSEISLILKVVIAKNKFDGFLCSAGCGSRLVSSFLKNDVPSYTVGFTPGESIDVDYFDRHNRSIVYYDKTSKIPDELTENERPMYVLARHIAHTTNHKKLICGVGCTELFRDSNNFKPKISHIVDQFAKFDIEIWSPFFDLNLMEYVLDTTHPEDRPFILSMILDDDFDHDGKEIYETVGEQETKKSWVTLINETVQRWFAEIK